MQDMRPGNGNYGPQPVEDESSKDLVREFVAEGKHLIREQLRLLQLEMNEMSEQGRQRFQQDLALAKGELKEEGAKAARAGGAVGIGGILTHAALYFALFAAVFGLSHVMPFWLACLIVAVVTAVVGAFLIKGGLDRFKRVQVVPRRTVHQLQEDRSWMKEKSRALRSSIRANA